MKKSRIKLACLISGVLSIMMLSTAVKVLVADIYVREQGVQLPGLLTVALWILVILCIVAQVLLVLLYRKWDQKPWAATLLTVLVVAMLVLGLGTDYSWNSAYKAAAQTQAVVQTQAE